MTEGTGAGEAGAERPTITVLETSAGVRTSLVTREDGTQFTVSVPAGAAEGDATGIPPDSSWITEHGPARGPSEAALDRLDRLIRGPIGDLAPGLRLAW